MITSKILYEGPELELSITSDSGAEQYWLERFLLPAGFRRFKNNYGVESFRKALPAAGTESPSQPSPGNSTVTKEH